MPHIYHCNDRDTDELRALVASDKLPAKAIVTAEQLTMRPGQKLREKARDLGVTPVTLRLWHAEWKGSGYDPDYVIQRAGHNNWRRTKWAERDWVSALHEQIAKGQHRHVGDLLLELGVPAITAQSWSQRHAAWEKALWHADPPVPYPKQHWRNFVNWIRHGTIDRYRALKAEKIAAGNPEMEAMHQAADEAVNELKHRTRQRRRIERDVLLGVTMGEEMARRWQSGGRLWDAHSRRIGKQLLKVGRLAAMERGLRAVDHDEATIERLMTDLVAAFDRSDEAGQEQWQKLRKKILQRKSRTEAGVRAKAAEATALAQMPSVRVTKFVKQAIEKR